MTENMKAFMDAIKDNEELKEKFNEISNKGQADQKDYTNEYIALAKECGITLTDEDFELDEGELSDEDLEKVSGGILPQSVVQAIFDDMKRMEEKERLKAQSQKQTQEQTQDQN